ncbi:hypothetical protein B9Z55_018774 [Caenorhabditis nigoni]|uniref:Uncharacterized protein n=3 Tax=Caenorhabditis nigoni TaxID=1611254 RepID=A0A2G5TFK6_9PELO|nr:hypothetical protein B9Z55_018774 [Caenorhabditis nigoni]
MWKELDVIRPHLHIMQTNATRIMSENCFNWFPRESLATFNRSVFIQVQVDRNMIRVLFLMLIFLTTSYGESGFPVQTLVSCGISQATINGVQGVTDDHSSMIKLAKSDKRAKKTEIDSLKADIDTYLESNASDDDKQKWIECVMKKTSNV